MSPEDLADANLFESLREHARWQEPSECVEQDGLLLIAGPNALPVGYRNCVARVDRRVTAHQLLDRARDFFGRRGRGFSVLTRTRRDGDLIAALPAAGLKFRSESPCMLIDAPLDEAAAPPDVRIERFTTEQQVRDAVRVNAEAYQAIRLAPRETEIFFSRPAALLSDRIVGFVAYRGAQPVSTALTLFSGGGACAGVYWVGTAAAAQRMGLGGICTRLATNAGFARGASVVTLQATPFGAPVYLRLGYRTYDQMQWYSHPAPAHAG